MMARIVSLIGFLLCFNIVAHAAEVKYFPVPQGSGPHDVWADADGAVWYTGQRNGTLGRLDPATGKVEEIPLGEKSAPHGVIVARDGGVWVTDGGLNAMVRYDRGTKKIAVYPLPAGSAYGNLNTPAFDGKGRVWFTGQAGIYGRVDPANGEVKIWNAPKGRGPYGIQSTPDGSVWYVSLAGNYLAKLDVETGAADVIEPPTPRQGARRVWPDSKGALWVSEWNSGNVSRYDPASKKWSQWKLPGEKPRTYSVYVDEQDKVWLTEWSANAIVRFDPVTEKFESFPSDKPGANVRQMAGRKGEAWGAESGTNRLVVVKY